MRENARRQGLAVSGREITPLAFVPKRLFFTKGVGAHEQQRVAMHHALRDAGVSDCNLVKVSSVIPPGCRIISRREGAKLLRPGNIVFAVIAMSETKEPHQRATVALGWATPDQDGVPGYIAEIEEEQAKGKTAKSAGDEVGQMALTLVAERLQTRIDSKSLWARSKRVHRIGGTTVHCGCITSTIIGDEKERYLSAVALALYL